MPRLLRGKRGINQPTILLGGAGCGPFKAVPLGAGSTADRLPFLVMNNAAVVTVNPDLPERRPAVRAGVLAVSDLPVSHS
jgi:hypothetical protein